MVDKNAVPEAEELDAEECWKLLRETGVGRLGVIADGRPDIFPVNYKVDGNSVVFLTGTGTKTRAIEEDAAVALEADAVSAEFGMAWSVIVKGKAIGNSSTEQTLDAVSRALFPWQGAGKDLLFRIVPDSVTGRRYTVTTDMRWRVGVDDASRAGME
ncbi:pyridoxamine 5'-phosphate oxidase family protein [Arthrobacter sp. CJ23]|uniref:pyridoxamine 5'-phosphate oxidase family protein n=1 Tax=Arthrobacter sp. CJ23 TaxID=2972479 RepID=UPI00215BF2E2|nr:pyridoxamine 5'-phosphate oxidase family protein [Arthrobacter sp. CJ23]UVJ41258.1 pyridoxamine 5'-phosphate oxidase family protein [Arthrobacter sp. CJ23]